MSLAQILTFFLLIGLVGASFGVSYSIAKKKYAQPVDCKPQDEWSAWSKCTRDCAGGQQYSTRSIAQMPLFGGQPCTTEQLLRSQSCPEYESVPCGQPCKPGNPNSYFWAPCPPCRKGDTQPVQYKIVPPAQTATYMGVDCKVDDVFFYRECEDDVPLCPPDIDCEIVPYTTSSCNVPCGSGTQLVFSSISQFPQGNGAPCQLENLIVEQSCYTTSCDCDALPWSNVWSDCNAACGPGVSVMIREPDPMLPNDGWCPYVSITSCTYGQCVPQANSPPECVAPSTDLVQSLCYLSCAGYPLPELDPSLCSVTAEMIANICGGASGWGAGYAGGSFDASGQAQESFLAYGLNDCVEPQDCSLSTWSDFGQCSRPTCSSNWPLGGTRTRVRTIVSPGNAGGVPCTALVYIDREPCNNQVPVSYTAFNTATEEYVQSVSSPECDAPYCSVSAFYSVSGFLGGCGNTCSQTWMRSITEFNDIELCPALPSYYVSVSTCCGSNPSFPSAQCGSLSSCTSCEWLSYQSLLNVFPNPLACPYNSAILSTKSIDMPLVQETNKPNENCNLNLPCEFNLTDTSSMSPFSCSSFFTICSAFPDGCPVGCDNLICSGHGTCIQKESGGTCSCNEGFSGEACEFFSATCPVASVSGLVCNGMGVCTSVSGPQGNTYSCVCNVSADTTPDCTGEATSWCWVYGEVEGKIMSSQFSYGRISKLLGALPIVTSDAYTFTEVDCTQLAIRARSSLTTLPSQRYLRKVSAAPIAFGQNAAELDHGNVSVYSITSYGLSGRVRGFVPTTLVSNLGLRQCASYLPTPIGTEANPPITSEQFVQLVTGPIISERFIQRYVPGSAPPLCESIFEVTEFDNQIAEQEAEQVVVPQQPPAPPYVQPFELYKLDFSSFFGEFDEYTGLTPFYLQPTFQQFGANVVAQIEEDGFLTTKSVPNILASLPLLQEGDAIQLAVEGGGQDPDFLYTVSSSIQNKVVYLPSWTNNQLMILVDGYAQFQLANLTSGSSALKGYMVQGTPL